MSERGGDAVDEVIGIEGAADVGGSIGPSAGEPERGKEVLSCGFGSLRGSEKVGARGDEIGASLDELGGEADRDFFGEKGEGVGRGDGGGRVAAKEDFE